MDSLDGAPVQNSTLVGFSIYSNNGNFTVIRTNVNPTEAPVGCDGCASGRLIGCDGCNFYSIASTEDKTSTKITSSIASTSSAVLMCGSLSAKPDKYGVCREIYD